MEFNVVNKKTYEHLLYDKTYNGVCWISSDKLHKYCEDRFVFSEEMIEDLQNGLLKYREDIQYVCLNPIEDFDI